MLAVAVEVFVNVSGAAMMRFAQQGRYRNSA